MKKAALIAAQRARRRDANDRKQLRPAGAPTSPCRRSRCSRRPDRCRDAGASARKTLAPYAKGGPDGKPMFRLATTGNVRIPFLKGTASVPSPACAGRPDTQVHAGARPPRRSTGSRQRPRACGNGARGLRHVAFAATSSSPEELRARRLGVAPPALEKSMANALSSEGTAIEDAASIGEAARNSRAIREPARADISAVLRRVDSR